MAHELGHAINLPHNRGTITETTAYGTALMGTGTYTYGKSPTFLTPADCAILNQNQVFQPTTSTTYYGAVTASLPIFTSSYNSSSQAIIANGTFSSTVPVKSVIIYLMPGGDTYSQVAWKQDIASGNAFSFSMPISELLQKGNTSYQMGVRLVCENGVLKDFVYSFRFRKDVPIINIH